MFNKKKKIRNLKRNQRILMRKYKRYEEEQTQLSDDSRKYKEYQTKMDRLDDKAERLRYGLYELGVIE